MSDGVSQIKTAKQIIVEAFLQLLGQEDFERLSVKEIVVHAGVSRSTFYLHFEDKYHLLEEVRASLNNSFLLFYTEAGLSETSTVERLCQHIFRYRSFYSHEFADHAAAHDLADRLARRLAHVFDDEDYAIFASHGTIGFLSKWVREGFVTSPSEAAEKLLKIGFTDWTERIV